MQVSVVGDHLEVIAGVPIRSDDPNLCGHFPGFPVFPGVFIVEALVQAVDIALRNPGQPRLRLRSVDSIRFLAPLLPPDRLTLDIVVTQDGADRWVVKASGRRADDTVSVTLRATFVGGTAPRPQISGPVVTGAGGAGLEHHQVRALLPQRYPLLLVDRVLSMTPGRRIEAVKTVTATEPCYRDLADDAPAGDYAYPASLLVESLGQAAALLWLAGAEGPVDDDHVLMFVGARNFSFDVAAYPGDLLRHVVHLERVIADTAFATGETYVGDCRVARVGTLMAARRPRTALTAPASTVTATSITADVPTVPGHSPGRNGASFVNPPRKADPS
nr:hypothetical protein [Micromonospora sp. HNM0581]